MLWEFTIKTAALCSLVAACGGGQSGGFRLPGDCVRPVAPSESQLPGMNRIARGSAGVGKLLPIDIDGDGGRDAMVSTAERCDAHGNCAYAIYVSRSGCGHFLGAVWAYSVRTAALAGRALRDVIAKTVGRDAEFEEWYRYQGSRLRCIAYREKQLYRDGRLEPAPSWGGWEACSPKD